MNNERRIWGGGGCGWGWGGGKENERWAVGNVCVGVCVGSGSTCYILMWCWLVDVWVIVGVGG